jgi:hypothetical protein
MLTAERRVLPWRRDSGYPAYAGKVNQRPLAAFLRLPQTS